MTIRLWGFFYYWILFAFLGDCINTPGLADVPHGVRAELSLIQASSFSMPCIYQGFRGSGIIFNVLGLGLGLRLYG